MTSLTNPRVCVLSSPVSSSAQMCRPHFHSPLHPWIPDTSKSMVPHAHSSWMGAPFGAGKAPLSHQMGSHTSLPVHPSASSAIVTSSSFSFPPTPPKDITPESNNNNNNNNNNNSANTNNTASTPNGSNPSQGQAQAQSQGQVNPAVANPSPANPNAGMNNGSSSSVNPNNSSSVGNSTPGVPMPMGSPTNDYSALSLPDYKYKSSSSLKMESSGGLSEELPSFLGHPSGQGHPGSSHTAHPVPTYPSYMGHDHYGGGALGFHTPGVFKSSSSSSSSLSSRPRAKTRSSTGEQGRFTDQDIDHRNCDVMSLTTNTNNSQNG